MVSTVFPLVAAMPSPDAGHLRRRHYIDIAKLLYQFECSIYRKALDLWSPSDKEGDD
jgi:hypothetical protein